MMWTTEADVRLAMHEAIRRSASVAGISNAETADVLGLFRQIESGHPVLHSALVEFLRNLVAWYFAHVEIERTQSAGRLTPEQAADLSKKIDEKRRSGEELAALIQGK